MEHDLKQHETAPAQVIPRQAAVSATRHVYPRLMIGGVYRMAFVPFQDGSRLAVYALPACAVSISRHRARMRLHRVRRVLEQMLTPSGADAGPRERAP